MKKTKDLSAIDWDRFFYYDNNTGHIHWKDGAVNTKKEGAIAGSLKPDGYVYVGIRNKVYSVHRAIYYMFTGDQPEEIDHIDGNKSNNKIENLRPANRFKNNMNKSIFKNNKTGIKGVSIHKNKYRAQCYKNGVNVYLGLYETLEEARRALVIFRSSFQGEFQNDG